MAEWVERLRPNEYVASVHDINLDRLWTEGKRLILTDLDNTLVPWNQPEVTADLADWLAGSKARGYQVCIVSNNHGPRVEAFARHAGIPFLAAARKPRPEAFEKALKMFRMSPEQTVMVGDQLFTDIRGGNRSGLYTVLVLPIHPREWWGTKMVRIAERIVMKKLVRRGLTVPSSRGRTP